MGGWSQGKIFGPNLHQAKSGVMTYFISSGEGGGGGRRKWP